MKRVDLAYLAGVMDSDGYFTIKRSTYNIRKIKDSHFPKYGEKVGLKQVQPQAIDLLFNNFGGYRRIEKPTAQNGKPLHSVSLTDRKANFFIKSILPFLRIKKKQAKILIDLRKSINEGKQGRSEIVCNSRWGRPMKTHRAITSPEQLKYRESLIKEIKSLNDIRYFSYMPI